MKYAVVDEAGRIKWHGVCADGEHQAQAANGAASVDITDLEGWADNPADFWFDHAAGEMKPRAAVEDLGRARGRRVADVNRLLAAKIGGGFAYQGHTFQVDARAVDAMHGCLVELACGAHAPSGGFWRDAANEHVPFTDAELRAFLLAASAYPRVLLRATWPHKAALNALDTAAALDAHDITAGWP